MIGEWIWLPRKTEWGDSVCGVLSGAAVEFSQEATNPGEQLRTQKDSSWNGNLLGVTVPDSHNLAGPERQGSLSGAARWQLQPQPPQTPTVLFFFFSRAGSWSVAGSPDSAVWVKLSIWHHIWCQWFGYCFTYFMSRWVLRDEASRLQKRGVWRKEHTSELVMGSKG